MELDPTYVGRRAQSGITHHVQVGESRQAQSLADAPATRALQIQQHLGLFVTCAPKYSVSSREVLYSPRGSKLLSPVYFAWKAGWAWKMVLVWPEIQKRRYRSASRMKGNHPRTHPGMDRRKPPEFGTMPSAPGIGSRGRRKAPSPEQDRGRETMAVLVANLQTSLSAEQHIRLDHILYRSILQSGCE